MTLNEIAAALRTSAILVVFHRKSDGSRREMVMSRCLAVAPMPANLDPTASGITGDGDDALVCGVDLALGQFRSFRTERVVSVLPVPFTTARAFGTAAAEIRKRDVDIN